MPSIPTSQVTHFKKLSGKDSLYVGARGSEALRADSTGCWTGAAGSETRLDSVGTQTFSVTLSGASTALEAAYITVPYASTLVSAYATISGGTTGTGGAFTITLSDTAGAALFGTATFASAGTAGSATITFGTMSTAQIAAVGVIAVVKASCATAFGATVVVTATKVALTV